MSRHTLNCQNKRIGYVDVEKYGMYYDISCVLEENTGRYRVILISGEKHLDLGASSGNTAMHGFRRFLPIKAVGEEGMIFVAIVQRPGEQFTVLSEEIPVKSVVNLDKCIFLNQQGVKGLIYRE